MLTMPSSDLCPLLWPLLLSSVDFSQEISSFGPPSRMSACLLIHPPGLQSQKASGHDRASLKSALVPCHCHANLLELIYPLGSPSAVTNTSFKKIQCGRVAMNAIVVSDKSLVTRCSRPLYLPSFSSGWE